MLGFAAYLAVRFPKLFKFASATWKPLAAIAVVGGLLWGLHAAVEGFRKTAFEAGHAAAQTEYTAAINEANEQAVKDQARLDQMAIAFGLLTSAREQEIVLQVAPTIERIKSEVANNPVYRDCAVGDGVLEQANAARSAVDASIAASNPR